MDNLLFTDYSAWNGKVKTEKAKAAGAVGAYWKASQARFTDRMVLENVGNSTFVDNGLYHFIDYANYPAGGEIYWGQQQAAYHVAIKDKLGSKITCRSAFDLEDNSGSGWPKLDAVLDKALKITLAWMNEYKTLTGHYPIGYLNSGLTLRKDYLGRWVFRNFTVADLWVANYTIKVNPPTGAWPFSIMNQFSSQGDGYAFGNAPGNKFVDLNTVTNLAKLRISGTVPVPVPEDEPVIVAPPVSGLKTYCKYCNGFTLDDSRGNCGACGAPREPLTINDRIEELWEDFLKRKAGA